MSTIADARERLAALDVTQSFIVQAPAGSGKTELLTQRVLALLARVERPEEIVAITFTRKAAAEMQHRIVATLREANEVRQKRRQPSSEAHKRHTHELAEAALSRSEALQWSLLDNPAVLRVQTIDSFCGAIARQMPLLSQMGQALKVSERAKALYLEAAENTLAALEESDSAVSEALQTLIVHLNYDIDHLKTLLISLLSRRDQWIRKLMPLWDESESSLGLAPEVRHFLEDSIDAVVADTLRRCASDHGDSLNAIRELAHYAATNQPTPKFSSLLDWNHDLVGDPAEIPIWCGLRALLLTDQGAVRARVDTRCGFPAKAAEGMRPGFKERIVEFLGEMSEGMAEALVAAAKLPPPGYSDSQQKSLNALFVALKRAAMELMLVFQRAGQVDFSEIQSRALLALGDEAGPTALALSLDYQIQHLLVDEFQDTSTLQFSLLEKLTAGWTPGDGRTLFLVGDPMQSIYRFREADVSLFLKAQKQGIGHVKLKNLTLRCNFRSAEGIVEWNNNAFKEVLPKRDDIASGAVKYSESTAVKPAEGDVAVSVWPSFGDGSEPDQVVEILLDNNHCYCETGATTAILVRSRSHVAEIARLLRRKGISYRAVEIERLHDRQSIQDLIALTKALLNLADRVNWLAVLRAPWCGLILNDLHAIAGGNAVNTIWTLLNQAEVLIRLTEEGRARVSRLVQVFGSLLDERGRMSPRRLVEKAWWQLGGDLTLREPSEMQDCLNYFALLDDLHLNEGVNLDEIDAEVEEMFATPDVSDRHVVEVLTIHKSKGLEFDNVLLPGLGKKSRREDSALLLWEDTVREEGASGLLLAPMRHSEEAASPIYRYIADLQAEKGRYELGRLLYVAATRAKRRLHLFGDATLNAKGEVKAAAGSCLELLWPALEAAYERAATEVKDDKASSGNDDWKEIPVPCLQRLPLRTLEQLPVVHWRPASHGDAAPLAYLSEDRHRIQGIVVHRLLEEFVRQGLATWNAERLRQCAGLIDQLLSKEGLVQDREQAVNEIIALLAGCMTEERFQWIFRPEHQLKAEIEITQLHEGEPRRRRLDLLLEEPSGTRWVIDWKTDFEALTDSAILAVHREQVSQYCRALMSMNPGVVRGAVYSVTQRKWVELC